MKQYSPKKKPEMNVNIQSGFAFRQTPRPFAHRETREGSKKCLNPAGENVHFLSMTSISWQTDESSVEMFSSVKHGGGSDVAVFTCPVFFSIRPSVCMC